MFLVLVVALTAIVGGLTLMTTTGVKSMGQSEVEEKALCIAEAGLHKAIWNLITPPDEGGMGMDWRTEGVTEEFAGGSYTIIVQDGPEGVMISSVSNFKGGDRTLQILGNEDLADDFAGYSLYSAADFGIDTLCEVSGNIFADGNVTIPTGSRVVDGVLVVTEGHTITGGGEFIEGDPAIIPGNPRVDPIYYNNQIAVAEAGGPSVVQGYQTYTDLDLNGLSLYVNGGVSLNGNISGGGEIIAAGEINIAGTAVIGEKIRLIAKGEVNVSASKKTCPKFKEDVVLYSGSDINIPNDFNNEDAIFILGSRDVSIGNNSQINGMIYGGNVYIGNSSIVQGISICALDGGTNTISDSTSIIYKKYKQSIPPGIKKKLTFGEWSME